MWYLDQKWQGPCWLQAFAGFQDMIQAEYHVYGESREINFWAQTGLLPSGTNNPNPGSCRLKVPIQRSCYRLEQITLTQVCVELTPPPCWTCRPCQPCQRADPFDPANPANPVHLVNPVDPLSPTHCWPCRPCQPRQPCRSFQPCHVDPAYAIDPVNPFNPVNCHEIEFCMPQYILK